MFFEPGPDGEEAAIPRLPESPPWSRPQAEETGAVLAVDQIVARSANVVVCVPSIRAYSTGCMIDVEVVSRQGDLSADDWWDLHHSGFSVLRSSGGGSLPRKLLRLGVLFADGAKATTLNGRRRHRRSDTDEPPAGPLLSWSPGGSGSRGREGSFSHFGLWLWPLPPAEPFEFAVEWPFGGIEESIVELDGAAIVTAAARSQAYWPGD
jgi:hypothetical protein